MPGMFAFLEKPGPADATAQLDQADTQLTSTHRTLGSKSTKDLQEDMSTKYRAAVIRKIRCSLYYLTAKAG
jgi:hypothetical protein